jgi:hypothetical protein
MMDTRRAIRGSLIVGFALAAGTAGAVPIHQHYITNGGGTHAIAMGFCKNGLQTALENFHWNVHTGTPSTDAFSNGNNPVSISAGGCPSP